MPGLNQMTSTSSGGASVITLQFDLDLDIDVAEQEVQAAINAVGHVSARRSAESADLQQDQSGRRADSDAGADVDDAAALGGRRPRRHADWRCGSRSSPASVWSASAAARSPRCEFRQTPRRSRRTDSRWRTFARRSSASNVNQAKGNFDGPQQAYTIGANDQLLSSAAIPTAGRRLSERRAGTAVRRRDVSTDSIENVSQAAWMNDMPAVIVNIQRQPGANIIAVVDRDQGAAAAAEAGAAGVRCRCRF